MAGAVLHFGGITSLNDVIIPKLMGLFTLNIGGVRLRQAIHPMNADSNAFTE